MDPVRKTESTVSMQGTGGESRLQVDWSALPQAPLTLEGAAVLHQIVRMRRAAWRELPADRRREIAAQAAEWLAAAETRSDGQSAVYGIVGDKGDWLWIHFRPDFAALYRAQRELAALELWQWMEPVWSFVSVVELGLYESTTKLWEELAGRGVAPHSPAVARSPAPGDAAATLPATARVGLDLLLPHEPAPRRAQELLPHAHAGAARDDARTR
jgi:hypothetical protein